MAKLYIFGIGGTGSRVIKALTMLLASGVKLGGDFDSIVPIIIDPDTANGDLNRTADILIKYQNIYNKIGGNNKLFGTKISTLTELNSGNVTNVSNNFKFSVDGSGQKFGESIDYNGLDEENKALVDLLFSKENLEADMTVGFKGNPNIGSVVLNKIVDSLEYKEFQNSFNQVENDAIFIISSIFGGTGASGFPLLLKNLRDESTTNKCSESKIGAITFLPYFKVDSTSDTENQAIDSSTFFSKAKSALSYYEHSIFKNNSLDAFYHLGNSANENIEYAEGKGDQKNNAHFLELAGALSIINFTESINNLDGNEPKEFGIEEASEILKFDNLGSDTKDKLSLPLSKLFLLQSFFEKSKKELLKNKGEFNKSAVTNDFYNKNFYKTDFSKFMIYYKEWMFEMEHNDVKFSPFYTDRDYDNLLNFIKGKELKSNFFSNKEKGDIIIKEANKIAKSKDFDNESEESRFIKIFDKVLEEQINDIL